MIIGRIFANIALSLYGKLLKMKMKNKYLEKNLNVIYIGLLIITISLLTGFFFILYTIKEIEVEVIKILRDQQATTTDVYPIEFIRIKVCDEGEFGIFINDVYSFTAFKDSIITIDPEDKLTIFEKGEAIWDGVLPREKEIELRNRELWEPVGC